MLSSLEFSGRLDAEYYRPLFLEYENLLKNQSSAMSDFANFLIGPFGSAFSVENYTDDKTYRYIRGKDVKQMKLMEDDNVHLPKEDFERLSKYALKENDILVSVVGTLGNAALVQKGNLPAIFSCKSTVLRVKNINPSYLLTYINCKYGRSLLLRKERGAIQKGLNLDDLKTLDVYIPSKDFQLKIEQLFKRSIDGEKQVKNKYSEAEQTLLEAVGLADFNPSTQNTNIKTFAQSFGASGRLDAEYYQPKYEEIESAIISFSGDFRLGDLIEYIDTGEYSEQYLSKEKDLKFYIRSTNIKNGLIDEHDDYFVNPDSFTKFAQKGDIVTARVGTLGVFGEVQDEIAGAVYSDNVLCFRLPNSFNSSVYTLWFNSKLNWELIDRFARGSVQQRLNQETLKGLLVPIIDPATQTKISELVQQSFSLKAQGEHLLSVAKRAVEIAIEQDEAAAMAFITKSL